MSDEGIARIPEVSHDTGRGRSSIYADVDKGLLTKPVAIGPRAVGWPRGEIRQINLARIAGKSEAEVRELVKQLHAARKVVA